MYSIMKTKSFTIFFVFLIILCISFSCIPFTREVIVLENENFAYEITGNGRNLHFVDKSSGTDYLFKDTVSYCAYIFQEGKIYPVKKAKFNGNLLTLDFGKTGVTAEISVVVYKDHITLEVSNIEGKAESLTFLNVPLTLDALPNESFAACALAMNINTKIIQLPALQNHLWASCYKIFGMEGAKISLIGVPQNMILPVIRNIMEEAEDIPHSTAGGAWAQLSEEGYGSYLMNFGTLTESTVDEWIEMCDNLGFNQVDSHGGGKFFRFGDFELNPEKWPDGWDNFKRINNRLHNAGISSIFHTYAFFIDKNAKYVTPVPHPDLAYFHAFTLAESIGPEDTVITVNESTAGISTITGFFVRNSVTLRIGDELISFDGVTDSPSFRFTVCKRGLHGTGISSHQAGEKAFHLKEMFGLFVPGYDTELFKEIAKHTAEIVNECNFDGIYFDAIDGSGILDGDENFWYHSTKFIFEVAKHLDHPVGMEMSAMIHHWWHYRSRWQAWDRPVRGYKRFVDIHSSSIKMSGSDHGLSLGTPAFIEKYAKVDNGSLLLPLHLGWWGNQTWDPPQVEPTFYDDIEYLCCKMIGNKAGLSMLGGMDEKTLDEKPLLGRLAGIIRQYESLRHTNSISDSMRYLLRQPGKEFTLVKNEEGKYCFKPVVYEKHKVEGQDHPSAEWKVNNEFPSQPVKLRIEVLMAVKSYNDTGNIILTDFSEEGSFVMSQNADGVSGSVVPVKLKKIPTGEPGCIFSALSTGATTRQGAYINMEQKFDPWLKLNDHKALGVWIKGDGNGQLLNFRLESPKHISFGARGDHFVKIDFSGWKYFELVEIESEKYNDYIWPELGIYDTYRHTINFGNIDKLQVWYNNLPEGKNVECLIGPVKALPMVSVTIDNPTIKAGKEEIMFPVQMKSGMFLELLSGSDCKLYGSKGELIEEVKIKGKLPELLPGNNEMSFYCNGPEDVNVRVQVTVISEGKPLED